MLHTLVGHLKHVAGVAVGDETAMDRYVLVTVLVTRWAVQGWGLLLRPDDVAVGFNVAFVVLTVWTVWSVGFVRRCRGPLTRQAFAPEFWNRKRPSTTADLSRVGGREIAPGMRRWLVADGALTVAIVGGVLLYVGDGYHPDWSDHFGMMGPTGLVLWGYCSVFAGIFTGLLVVVSELATTAVVAGVGHAAEVAMIRVFVLPAVVLVGILRFARFAPVVTAREGVTRDDLEGQYALAAVLLRVHNQLKGQVDAAARAVAAGSLEHAAELLSRAQAECVYTLNVGGGLVPAGERADTPVTVWDAVHGGATDATDAALAVGKGRQEVNDLPGSQAVLIKLDPATANVLREAVCHAVSNAHLHACDRATIRVTADVLYRHANGAGKLAVSVRDTAPDDDCDCGSHDNGNANVDPDRRVTGTNAARTALATIGGTLTARATSGGYLTKMTVPLTAPPRTIRPGLVRRAVAVSSARHAVVAALAKHPDDEHLAAADRWLRQATEEEDPDGA